MLFLIKMHVIVTGILSFFFLTRLNNILMSLPFIRLMKKCNILLSPLQIFVPKIRRIFLLFPSQSIQGW